MHEVAGGIDSGNRVWSPSSCSFLPCSASSCIDDAALELGVDLALLGLAVRDQQLGHLLSQRVAVVLLVAQLAQQGLEEPVVVEEYLDHVALLGTREGGEFGLAMS